MWPREEKNTNVRCAFFCHFWLWKTNIFYVYDYSRHEQSHTRTRTSQSSQRFLAVCYFFSLNFNARCVFVFRSAVFFLRQHFHTDSLWTIKRVIANVIVFGHKLWPIKPTEMDFWISQNGETQREIFAFINLKTSPCKDSNRECNCILVLFIVLSGQPTHYNHRKSYDILSNNTFIHQVMRDRTGQRFVRKLYAKSVET